MEDSADKSKILRKKQRYPRGIMHKTKWLYIVVLCSLESVPKRDFLPFYRHLWFLSLRKSTSLVYFYQNEGKRETEKGRQRERVGESLLRSHVNSGEGIWSWLRRGGRTSGPLYTLNVCIDWNSLKGSQAEKTSSPRLKMPPFSTDIDPRRCSSRDYTSRPWFPSLVSSNKKKYTTFPLPGPPSDWINLRYEIRRAIQKSFAWFLESRKRSGNFSRMGFNLRNDRVNAKFSSIWYSLCDIHEETRKEDICDRNKNYRTKRTVTTKRIAGISLSK